METWEQSQSSLRPGADNIHCIVWGFIESRSFYKKSEVIDPLRK